VCIGFLKERIQVFYFFLYTVIAAEWPAQTPAAAVWNKDHERIGQSSAP
jgi:hypothetical protein